MKLEIRRCGEADLDALRRIGQQTYDETFRSMNSPETMEAYLSEAFDSEKLRAELQNPHCRFFFLYADGELAGYLKLNDAPAQTDIKDPESLEVERFYIRSEHQGKGLGRLLMRHVLEVAAESRVSYIWLGVWERNLDAIAFYERMGFREAGRHEFRMGNEVQSDLLMRKAL